MERVDGLEHLDNVDLDAYVRAASEYVRSSIDLTDSQKKTGQIRLSAGLAVALRNDLLKLRKGMQIRAGEHKVAGALRIVQADLSEFHSLDGLRLAVEIKPVNLSVGRAIWNRFGDIRTFSVNLHLKFPFAVVGGIITIPLYEMARGTKGDRSPRKKPRGELIRRAISRLVRAGGRGTEGDAAHLLEAICAVIYDPDTAALSEDLPPKDSGLRWEQFITALVNAYDARFEGQEAAAQAASSDDSAPDE